MSCKDCKKAIAECSCPTSDLPGKVAEAIEKWKAASAVLKATILRHAATMQALSDVVKELPRAEANYNKAHDAMLDLLSQ